MALPIPDLSANGKTALNRAVTAATIAMLVAVSAASLPRFAYASAKTFTLTVERKRVGVGGGMTFNAWTYSGTMPGPVLKVVQGDDVKIDLINHTKDAHGINVHAAQISPQHFDGDPMKSVSYTFPAEVPGVFTYNCTATPVLDHIASGMYGTMIVEPKAGWPDGNAQEITIVQSELYGLPDAHGFIVGSHAKMVEARPDFVVFNGALHRYDVEHPIEIKVGKLVRVFFVNAGPNLTSAFHVTGVLFDTVYKGGNPANAMHGLNTLEVAPSDGAVFEFRVTQPGDYQFMDLNRAQQYKGANGVFRATP
ncbi:MAG TPA: multicopper oxidase domain-containing protein [Candidatus Binataceae bacterium]|nr:multicopper oxidase domain-containing protein [Candidatus Binataceae bacterium]